MSKAADRRYSQQRPKKTPPHISLRDLRSALGLTLDEVSGRITEDFPELAPTRGALSAIESGTRGVSQQMLVALCSAYGLPAGAISLDYEPRGLDVSA